MRKSVASTVGAILARGEQHVWALPPTASVFEAIEMMANKRVGSVLVVDGESLVGIVTERDYARKVFLQGRSSRDTLVSQIMSTPVIFVTPEHTVDDCLAIITRQQIRFLPVLENNRILGMVSAGDLLREITSDQDDTIQHLEAYISGKYPA
jgi:CBS domain-containing protein